MIILLVIVTYFASLEFFVVKYFMIEDAWSI